MRTDAGVGALRVLLGAVEDAEEVLDVVAVLVGDDVLLGELAAVGAELALQLLEEARVDVDLRVERAVEGTDLRVGGAALRLRLALVDDGLHRLVVHLVLRQRLGPVVLDAVDGRDDEAHVVLVGVGARLALGELPLVDLSGGRDLVALELLGRGGRRRVLPESAAAEDLAAAEDEHEHEQDEAADAASDLDAAGEASASAATTAAAALHL